MLEDEWDEDAEPGLLIRHGVRSLRKKRLVAAACARRVLHLIPDPAFEWVLGEAARYEIEIQGPQSQYLVDMIAAGKRASIRPGPPEVTSITVEPAV